MGLCRLLLWLAALVSVTGATEWTNQWAVRVPGGLAAAERAAKETGFHLVGQIVDDYFHFEHRCEQNSNTTVVLPCVERHRRSGLHSSTLEQHPHVTEAVQQKRLYRDRRLVVTDPWFADEWYIKGNPSGTIEVEPVWDKGYTGIGVVVTVVDDGIEYDHPDLKANYDANASWDMNGNDPDPYPNEADPINSHGTRCCGQIAMALNNNVCGVGIAYKASIGGVRMLDGDVTDLIEARSLGLNPQHIMIYTNSWGPNDDGRTMEGPGPLAAAAFKHGVEKGRNKLGSIYLFANGNGGAEMDNCNADGYSNSIYTIAIGAIANDGSSPWYAEQCSATMAVTYSSGGGGQPSIMSVDLHHGCTTDHTGTSAASPMAAGILALVLQANPNLNWRDMQHLIALTSDKTWPQDSDWQTNAAGLSVNHKFGFGNLNTLKLVTRAETWVSVGQQYTFTSSVLDGGNANIPYTTSRTGALHVTYTLAAGASSIVKLEHVQVTVNVDCERRGDYVFELVSPQGTSSTLMTARPYDYDSSGIHWTFMTVRNWNENPVGTWHLYIRNALSSTDQGSLSDWTLTLYGYQPPAISCPVGQYFNTSTDACAACHSECSTDGCTSGGPAGCKSCAHFKDGSTCVANCTLVGKFVTPGTSSCLTCHPECHGCTGPSPYECIKCAHNLETTRNGTECTYGCRSDEYADDNETCQSCDEQCAGGCSGPGPMLCVHCANYITDNHTCAATCPPDTYVHGQLCAECDPNCGEAGCTGPGPAHCLSCEGLRLLLPAGAMECVTECPESHTANTTSNICECSKGTYSDIATMLCQPCSSQCAVNTTCKGPDESDCTEKCADKQYNKDCVTTCPARTFSTDINATTWSRFFPAAPLLATTGCLPCHFLCASGCSGYGPANCLNGTAGRCTLFSANNTCVSACPPSTYADTNGVCQPCNEQCDDCDGPDAGSCTSCRTARFNGTCVSACPAHNYVNTFEECAHCHDECAFNCTGGRNDQCLPSATTNTTCAHLSYTRPSDGATVCVSTCPVDFYRHDTHCYACDSECEGGCTGPTTDTCVDCQHYINGSFCVATCPPQTYVNGSLYCVACDASCKNGCDGPGSTGCRPDACSNVTCSETQRVGPTCACQNISCTTGQLIDAGACVARCSAGKYASGSMCRACDTQCAGSCSGPGPSNCSSCRYASAAGVCVASCPDGTFLNTLTLACMPCHQECSVCDGPLSTDCSACKHVQLLSTSECLATCPRNTYETPFAVCAQCHPLCDGCRGVLPTDCIGCSRYLFNTTCVRDCPSGFFPLNRTCVACSSECRVGCSAAGPTSCTAGLCKNYKSVADGVVVCVSQCETDQYADATQTCKACNASCVAGFGCTGPRLADCGRLPSTTTPTTTTTTNTVPTRSASVTATGQAGPTTAAAPTTTTAARASVTGSVSPTSTLAPSTAGSGGAAAVAKEMSSGAKAALALFVIVLVTVITMYAISSHYGRKNGVSAWEWLRRSCRGKPKVANARYVSLRPETTEMDDEDEDDVLFSIRR